MNELNNKKDFLNKVDIILERLVSKHDLSVTNVAKELNIQAQQLRRIIIAITGENCSEYIKNFRIERAKRLLVSHDILPIAKIGFMCGFDEPTHFTRFFRRATGITPKEYRNKETQTSDNI